MTLSVVIAASSNPALLEKCLESLRNQAQEADAEIVVVCNYSPQKTKNLETLRERFSNVEFFVLPPSTTVPMLRTYGIQNSRGDIVALLEDNVVADQNWCAQIIQAHLLPQDVVGGSVENQSEGALNWAVYFYEYGKYMRPNAAGTTDTLAGNNVSYKKEVLARVEEFIREGFYEAFVHPHLVKIEYSMYLAPDAVVYHCKSHRLREVLHQCYHHGRAFAGMRTLRASRLKRLIFAGFAFLLPVVLTMRIARRILAKGRNRRELVLALPFLMLFMTVWAYGEWCGYLRGAGDSATQWR